MILLMNSKLSEHDLLHSGRFGAARILATLPLFFLEVFLAPLVLPELHKKVGKVCGGGRCT